MKIYIDFDDVICETARHYTVLARELFGIDLPYEDIQFFDLKKAFRLNDEQYEALMAAGHRADNLLSHEETPYASAVINSWINAGHEVYVITGRPFNSYDPSRQWLDDHGLSRTRLYCVDKYGRENMSCRLSFSMSLEELYELSFDIAIEDSPASFEHIMHFEGCRVFVFDRPWNRKAELPGDNFIRCRDWEVISRQISAMLDEDTSQIRVKCEQT